MRTRIDLEGDFFRRDPGKTVRQNIRDLQDELASWAEQEVRRAMVSRAGAIPGWTGWTADRVRGYTASTKTGSRWGLWSAVGVPTTGMSREDAIRTKAAAKQVEARTRAFSAYKSAIRRARPLIVANLTEGLND